MENPFMKLIADCEEMWHERKGLDYTPEGGGRKRIMKRMEKKLAEIKEHLPKVEAEFKNIKELYKIQS